MFTGYKALQEQGGQAIPINWTPEQKAQYQATSGNAPAAAPQPAQQIKITRGNTTFVVAWIAASKAWCVYRQQPGSAKAQLQGKPMPDIKDAFLSVLPLL